MLRSMSAFGALLLIGCSSLHTLTIDLYTDLTPGTDFDAVEIEVDGVLANPFAASDVRTEGETRIHESMLTDGRHMVRVALTLGGTSVIAQDYVVQLERDLIIAARLRRSCVGVICDDGVSCTLDNCDEGVCTHVPDASACGLTTCDPDVVGADPVTGCAAGGVCGGRAAGFVCRAARGTCDVEETCDGVSTNCPVDVLLPTSAVCRESGGACDREESCLGNATACPADQHLPMGTACRPSAGVCDAVEVCDGEGVACPVDAFAGSGTVCRAVAGACDRAEACSGSAASCPSNGFLASGTVCRAALSGCDVPERCGGTVAQCPGGNPNLHGSDVLDAPDEMRPLLTHLTSGDLESGERPALVAWATDQVQVLVNVGGRLRPSGTYASETLYGVALADLDGDGILDLVMLVEDRLLGRQGLGDGTFGSTPAVLLVAPGLHIGTTAMAGIAADVHDVPTTVVLLRDEMVLTTRRVGAAALVWGMSYPVAHHTALAIGDVDGDELPDIVTSGGGSFGVLFGVRADEYHPHDSPYPIDSLATEILIRPLHCAPGSDLVFMDPRGHVTIVAWDGGGLNEATRLDGPEISAITLTDLDDDGGVDVVALSPGLGFVYWRSTGELLWNGAEIYGDPSASRWLFAFDGDGLGGDEILSGDGSTLRVMTR